MNFEISPRIQNFEYTFYETRNNPVSPHRLPFFSVFFVAFLLVFFSSFHTATAAPDCCAATRDKLHKATKAGAAKERVSSSTRWRSKRRPRPSKSSRLQVARRKSSCGEPVALSYLLSVCLCFIAMLHSLWASPAFFIYFEVGLRVIERFGSCLCWSCCPLRGVIGTRSAAKACRARCCCCLSVAAEHSVKQDTIYEYSYKAESRRQNTFASIVCFPLLFQDCPCALRLLSSVMK